MFYYFLLKNKLKCQQRKLLTQRNCQQKNPGHSFYICSKTSKYKNLRWFLGFKTHHNSKQEHRMLAVSLRLHGVALSRSSLMHHINRVSQNVTENQSMFCIKDVCEPSPSLLVKVVLMWLHTAMQLEVKRVSVILVSLF